MAPKRLVPLFNRVLVEKIVPSSKTTAGILLPEKTAKLNSGIVVAVGPGARDKSGNVIPVSVKEGDTVLLPEYGGTEVKLADKECCNNFFSVARSCYTFSTLTGTSLEHEGLCKNSSGAFGIFGFPTTIICGLSAPSKSFCSRYISSGAGERSNDKDDDLEGFSDLDVSREADEGDITRKENDEGSSASETNSGTKMPEWNQILSPIFHLIMEAPQKSVNAELDKWVEDGNPLGRGEISLAILKLRSRRLYAKALQFVEWLEANNHIDLVERDYASHLDLVGKVNGLYKAEKYMEKIPESVRGEVVYRTLLANCVAAVNVKKAEEVFNKMRDLGFPMTTFACNQLLILYKRMDQKKIPDVLLMMEKENLKPSLFTYKLLIDIKGGAKDISGMEQILETMMAEGVKPDLLIQAMIAYNYIFAGLNDKAEATLKQIEGDDIKWNRLACKIVLPIYAHLGKADDVARIWEVCEPNPRLEEFLAAIEAWGKLGKVENAEKIFKDMLNKGKKLSSKYYNALLKVYANHKLLEKGEELTKQMADDGCSIGPCTWDALVKLYVEAGEVEKADSILQKTSEHNPARPHYRSYMAVLDSYAKRGDIHNAEKIFHRLRQEGFLGRVLQYQSLLQAYIKAKIPAYGIRERMKADNVFPNEAVAAQLAAVDAFKKNFQFLIK